MDFSFPVIPTLLLFLAVVFVWVQWIEPNWFHLRRKTIRVAKPLRKPLTVLHLSDPHFTRHRFFLGRFFDRLSRLDVDFVFVTGDLTDSPAGTEPCLANLKKLKPRHGMYAVLGNHDYCRYPFFGQWARIVTRRCPGVERRDSHPESLKKSLGEAGIRLLSNENLRVKFPSGDEINIIGVDDPVTGRADLDAAFRGRENGVPEFALVHAPRVFRGLFRRGVDVAFSGHTHGGQIRLPGVGPFPLVYWLEPIIDSVSRKGFFGIVSRGLGATPTASLRFFCRPEVLLVRIEGS